MNICMVCYPTYGGSGIVATELGKSLAKRGHKVHFVSYDHPVRLDAFKQNLFYHELTFPTYPLFKYPAYESALSSLLVDVVKNNAIDIIHVHYALPHASVAYMAQQILAKQDIHVPIVTTLHGTDITLVGKDPSFEPVISFAIEHSNAVTAVSQYLKQATYEHFSVRKQIDVIPNFVDMKVYTAYPPDHALRKRFASDDEYILMHVSNFRKVKRVADVLHICAKVLQTTPVRLVMIGDGPERPALQSLCRKLNLCDKVHFLGKIKKVERLLAVADVFLIPSGSESFGLAALEALAAWVPVVSSDVWWLPELNIHEESGYIAPVGDTVLMAKYVTDMLGDPLCLAQYKKRARERAQHFLVDDIVSMYEEVYERVKV